MLKTTLSHEV